MKYKKGAKAKPGTYTFDNWGDACTFCQENRLPIEDIDNVYLNYKVKIEK